MKLKVERKGKAYGNTREQKRERERDSAKRFVRWKYTNNNNNKSFESRITEAKNNCKWCDFCFNHLMLLFYIFIHFSLFLLPNRSFHSKNDNYMCWDNVNSGNVCFKCDFWWLSISFDYFKDTEVFKHKKSTNKLM